jgi:hypothetical protein
MRPRTFFKTIAAFATLTVLLAGTVLGQTCPPEGDARSLPVRQLNVLKNRTTAPMPPNIDPGVTLQAMVAPGDDLNRFDERLGAVIRGFVVRVLPGGVETVNCHARGVDHRDTHIELALSPTAPPTDRVIVEVTPPWRAITAARGIDWRTHTLAATLVGHWVEIGGWLLLDVEHLPQSRNTEPNNPNDWRATAWEIHPITSIRALQ